MNDVKCKHCQDSGKVESTDNRIWPCNHGCPNMDTFEEWYGKEQQKPASIIIHSSNYEAAKQSWLNSDVNAGILHIGSAPKDGSDVLVVSAGLKTGPSTVGMIVNAHWMEGGHCIEDHPPIDRGWYYLKDKIFRLVPDVIGWIKNVKQN